MVQVAHHRLQGDESIGHRLLVGGNTHLPYFDLTPCVILRKLDQDPSEITHSRLDDMHGKMAKFGFHW